MYPKSVRPQLHSSLCSKPSHCLPPSSVSTIGPDSPGAQHTHFLLTLFVVTKCNEAFERTFEHSPIPDTHVTNHFEPNVFSSFETVLYTNALEPIWLFSTSTCSQCKHLLNNVSTKHASTNTMHFFKHFAQQNERSSAQTFRRAFRHTQQKHAPSL